VPARHENRHEERQRAEAGQNDERVPGVAGLGVGWGGTRSKEDAWWRAAITVQTGVDMWKLPST